MRGICSMGGLQQDIPVTPITSTTYVTNAASATGTTTPSFGTISIGTAASNRYVIVMVSGFAINDSITSLTIAGTAATLLYTAPASGTTVWGLLVTTGTTAAISGSGATTAQAWGASVWRVLSSSLPSVPNTAAFSKSGGSAVGYDAGSATITTSYTNSPVIAQQITQHNSVSGAKRFAAALLATTTTGSFTISTTNSSTNVTFTGATEQFDVAPFNGTGGTTTSLDLFALE